MKLFAECLLLTVAILIASITIYAVAVKIMEEAI